MHMIYRVSNDWKAPLLGGTAMPGVMRPSGYDSNEPQEPLSKELRIDSATLMLGDENVTRGGVVTGRLRGLRVSGRRMFSERARR